jgi:hypothetical protein
VYLRNISIGGAELEGKTRLAQAAEVTVFLSSTPRVAVKGRVRWLRKKQTTTRFGVEFFGPTPEQHKCIAKMCQVFSPV